jgi:hypothetical protein
VISVDVNFPISQLPNYEMGLDNENCKHRKQASGSPAK